MTHWYGRRRGRIQRWAHIIVPSCLLLTMLALRVSQLSWVEQVQHKAFDVFQQMSPRSYEPTPVRIIDLDDETLDKLGQWPWPRTLVARLVRRLSSAGASCIAFDIVFSEPDRTSPARVLDAWPQSPELEAIRRQSKTLPDHDDILAAQLSRSRAVTGFVLTGEGNGVTPLAKAPFAYAGTGPLAFLPDFPGAVVSLPRLQEAASGNGGFGFIPEPDGIIRRAPLIFRRGQTLLPSLSAEALRVSQDARNFAVKSSGGSGETGYGQKTGISAIKIGRFKVPTDAGGAMWIHFTAAAPGRTIAAWKVLQEGADLSGLKGAIAFIGTSAAGLKDLRATPLAAAAPGVEVHANAVEQMLLGHFLERPDWALGAEFSYMLLLGLILIVLLPRLGAGWGAWLAALGIAGCLRFSWWAFTEKNFLIDPVFPAATVLLVYMASSLISYLKSETERRQVRSAFGQYLHPKLVEELAKHPDKLVLGGEIREMTILFCDIRGFTSISEQFDAHGLTQMMNLFLTPMTAIIMERYGYIDKYIGDCIMAFWNAPADDAEHAQNACLAALRMQERLRELNAEWKAEAAAENRQYLPINIGVGLNTGPCCVGNMGADQKFNYSVLGDDVNLASRLEGQSKYYGVDIVIGPKTRELAPEFACLELDIIRVKGKTKPVKIFCLLGGPELASSESFLRQSRSHEAMLAAYRAQDWSAAAQHLAECRKTELSLKGLYDLYESRLKTFAAASPGPSWDGTFTATSK